MGLLDQLYSPADLKRLDPAELPELAGEIRQFLVRNVARTGGHLGPNLGVVELTMALHRVFDSPRDALVFDTGHQAYVHKMITGRCAGFDRLRKSGGLSGYPSRAESEHDWVENSHASTALSYADGIAKAAVLSGGDRHAVAVVGDGALTGGMCWEALNNIASRPDLPLVIVVNDNGRSYSPTIGGLADHLATLRLRPSYERALDTGKRTLQGVPMVGGALYAGAHAVKRGLKDAISPQVMFEDLGLKYFGPIDGHDHEALEQALERAKAFCGPVIVHVVTRKGAGFAPAENHEADQMHSTDAIDPETGEQLAVKGPGWTGVFSDEMVAIGRQRADVVALTAAMLHPTGLAAFAEEFPDRCFDVGIAEQHAMTSAAGLAMGGYHPVLALYATFLNRAFDQLLMDVGLHSQPVTIVLDRAGITGSDGPSHNGMWDFAVSGIVPGMRVAAPRDGRRLREELREAVAADDGPTLLRYPKGEVSADLPAVQRVDGMDVLRRPDAGSEPDVLLLAVGSLAELALEVADGLAAQGFGVTVVDPRWVLPVPEGVATMAAEHRLVVTVEDGAEHGGIGWAVRADLQRRDCEVPARGVAIPQRYLEHGSRGELLAEVGLSAQDIARSVTEWVVRERPGMLDVSTPHGHTA